MNKFYPTSGTIKKWLARLIIAGLLLLLAVLLFYFLNRGPKNQFLKEAKKVSIRQQNGHYSFFRNDSAFMVKGGAGFTHIKELVACGGNTIICWDTSKLASTLAEAAKNNVAVIIGLDIPNVDNLDFYRQDSNINRLLRDYGNVVLRYKDQPALLAWCLGNELEMPLSFSAAPFYTSYNRLLAMIHRQDTEHPVSTSVINVAKRYIFNIQWRIPALDFISINSYNSIRKIESDLDFIKWMWNGPYLIGEWSPNGGWEAPLTIWQAPIESTSTQKAALYNEFYTRFMPRKDPRFLGSMVFYWGSRLEYTHTWYSIFNEDDTPTETMEVLSDCWKDTVTKHLSPRLQDMKVDNLAAQSNIILSPGSLHQATVFLDKTALTDTLAFEWQIVKEDWQHWGFTWDNFKKPAMQTGLLPQKGSSEVIFKAPAEEGPYRIFVTVKNRAGFCATANTPIYVVQ